MNPLRWIRWKVLIVLAVLFGGLYFLGLNPLAKMGINDLGASASTGARFGIDQVGLGLLSGRSEFDGFRLATPRKSPAGAAPGADEKEKVAKADQLVFALGMNDLLRKRFAVDELSVKKPLITLQRREDGSVNVGDLGAKEPEAKPSGKPTDWLGSAKEWAEKLRKRWEEKQKRDAEKGKKPEPPKDQGAKADYALKATYPFEDIPGLVVRKVSAEAVEINFEDQSAQGLKPPPIQNAAVTIENLSDRPDLLKEPTRLSLKGTIGGAPLEIGTTIDLRKILETGLQKNDFLFTVKASGLPIKEVVQALAGGSLNANFEKGTADVQAEVNLLDFNKLSVKGLAGAPLFALHGVQMSAKPGSKIAGIDGEQFAQGVNSVGDIEIRDLEIGGTLMSPVFKWGDSIQNIVTSAVKGAAQKQAQKGLEKAASAGQKLLDKQIKDPQQKKAIENLIPGGDLKKASEKASGLFGNILGGKKDPPQDGEKK